PLDHLDGPGHRGDGAGPDRGPGRPRGAAGRLPALPRDRREGDAGGGVPHPQAPRAPGGRAMRRGLHLLRRVRQGTGRWRKLTGLVQLLRPYRSRVIAMFVALALATAASLAPAPLAKLAIDQGISRHDI